MKKISSIIILIFLSGILWGQSNDEESTNESFKYQIGTDISPLFRNLFKSDLSAQSLLNAPYVFTFKSMKNNRAFRFGIGADIRREISNESQPDTIVQNSIRVRMGFEKQKKISKRWQINTGIDFKYSTSKFEDSNNISLNNLSKAYEISPILGIQFQLTNHLSLQTEASFNLYYQTNSFDSPFDIIFPGPFPTFTARDFKTFGGNITIPNALLLVVEF